MVRVVAGTTATPVLAIERGAVIAGRVLTPNGQPVPDTRVSAVRRRPGVSGGQLMMAGLATTNDLGEFRLHSLAAGEVLRPGRPATHISGGTHPSNRDGDGADLLIPARPSRLQRNR